MICQHERTSDAYAHAPQLALKGCEWARDGGEEMSRAHTGSGLSFDAAAAEHASTCARVDAAVAGAMLVVAEFEELAGHLAASVPKKKKTPGLNLPALEADSRAPSSSASPTPAAGMSASDAGEMRVRGEPEARGAGVVGPACKPGIRNITGKDQEHHTRFWPEYRPKYTEDDCSSDGQEEVDAESTGSCDAPEVDATTRSPVRGRGEAQQAEDTDEEEPWPRRPGDAGRRPRRLMVSSDDEDA